MVQHRAVRYIFNDYGTTSSVTAMLNKLSLPTLENRRKISSLVMFYKINTGLVRISLPTWFGVNTSLKFHLRQLRHWVFFGAIWPLHLGTLRKLHTKHWFVLSSSMQHLFGIPIMKLRLDRWRRYRGQLPGGPAGDGETPVASATCLTILSGHPWRPAGSSLP